MSALVRNICFCFGQSAVEHNVSLLQNRPICKVVPEGWALLERLYPSADICIFFPKIESQKDFSILLIYEYV